MIRCMDAGRRRARPVVVALAGLVILLASTGVVVQSAISDSLGHTLIGCGVLGALVLSIIGLRKRSG
jgi:hypothetical protein